MNTENKVILFSCGIIASFVLFLHYLKKKRKQYIIIKRV